MTQLKRRREGRCIGAEINCEIKREIQIKIQINYFFTLPPLFRPLPLLLRLPLL